MNRMRASMMAFPDLSRCTELHIYMHIPARRDAPGRDINSFPGHFGCSGAGSARVADRFNLGSWLSHASVCPPVLVLSVSPALHLAFVSSLHSIRTSKSQPHTPSLSQHTSRKMPVSFKNADMFNVQGKVSSRPRLIEHYLRADCRRHWRRHRSWQRCDPPTALRCPRWNIANHSYRPGLCEQRVQGVHHRSEEGSPR